MQIAGELQKRAETGKKITLRPPEGMIKTAAGVIRNEGFLKLWSGILPACMSIECILIITSFGV